MLPIHVVLWALTGRAEMSVLKMLFVGKSAQVVPGMGSASADGAVGTDTAAASSRAAAIPPGIRLTPFLTASPCFDCWWVGLETLATGCEEGVVGASSGRRAGLVNSSACKFT